MTFDVCQSLDLHLSGAHGATAGGLSVSPQSREERHYVRFEHQEITYVSQGRMNARGVNVARYIAAILGTDNPRF